MVQNDKPIVKFLNIMVLLSSILVLVIISIELLSATTIFIRTLYSEYPFNGLYDFPGRFLCPLVF